MTTPTGVNDRLFDRCRSARIRRARGLSSPPRARPWWHARRVKRGVERIEFVKVAMPADWRARTIISRLFEVVDAAHRTFGQAARRGIFGETRGVGGNVVEHPMHPDASRRFRIRRVWIVQDQRESSSFPPARRPRQAAARCPCPRKYRSTVSALRRRTPERSVSEPWPRRLLAPTARARPTAN